MTIPLPEPAGVIIVGTQALRAFTADQLRAYGDARAAEERERWREIAEQLIACHEEPTCPAVTLARERLDAAAIRKGE